MSLRVFVIVLRMPWKTLHNTVGAKSCSTIREGGEKEEKGRERREKERGGNNRMKERRVGGWHLVALQDGAPLPYLLPRRSEHPAAPLAPLQLRRGSSCCGRASAPPLQLLSRRSCSPRCRSPAAAAPRRICATAPPLQV